MSLYTHSEMMNINHITTYTRTHRKQGTVKTVQVINDQEVNYTLKTELLMKTFSVVILTP